MEGSSLVLRLTALALVALVAMIPAQKAKSGQVEATWYGPGFEGNTTASGETFHSEALTAAHPSLPFGTRLEVCYDGCTVVRITDRGPFSDADLDLSRRAADEIGLTNAGKAPVEVAEEPGPKAPVGKLPATGAPGR